MKLFGRSLTFKIGVSIILIEIIVLALVGVNYAASFFSQIDQRVQDRIQLPAQLINTNLIRLVSIGDRASVTNLVGEEIEDAILVDNDGRIVFSFDAELRGESVTSVPDIDPSWFDTSNTESIFERLQSGSDSFLVNVAPIQDPITQDELYRLYIKTSINAAEAEKARVVQLLLIGSIATVLATTGVIFLSFNSMIFSRLRELLKVLQLVEQGNLAARVTGKLSADEIGTLQKGFNSMITRLEGLVGNLEARVEDRTRDLQIAADVSKQITTVMDLNTLLRQVVDLTKTSFNLYQVSIFLFMPDKQILQLEAASGSTGEQMLSERKQFRLSDTVGLVPKAARSRDAVLINDVTASLDHFPNPLLPETKSELALPMVSGKLLLGVLDLQSNQLDRFSPDDLRTLTTLAEQIAVAIRNAQLFTQAQDALQEAEKANQIKSMFLASVSHELRTPLNSIINFTKFVIRGVMGPVNEEQTHALTKVVNSGHHLLNLINDVLDISKIESGSLTLFVENDVDLRELLQSVMTTAESLLNEKPVELRLDVDPNLPLIRADRQRIFQIMLNIVSNACKFTEEGSITISAQLKDGEVMLAVKDTGPGIAEEDHQAVFEAFRQTQTGLRQGSGTGLGMPISRSLAEAHGGKMWLESAEGAGTTFFVVLPVASELLLDLVNT